MTSLKLTWVLLGTLSIVGLDALPVRLVRSTRAMYSDSIRVLPTLCIMEGQQPTRWYVNICGWLQNSAIQEAESLGCAPTGAFTYVASLHCYFWSFLPRSLEMCL